MTRLDSTGPVREIKISRRSLTGRVATNDGAVSFESSLERDWIVLLDFDTSVREIKEQPFSLRYLDGSRQRKYTPDVMARFTHAFKPDETVVYEVKPRDELKANWPLYEKRFRAATRHCKQAGWHFRIVTEREIRTPLLGNAQFLRRYRNLDRDTLACKQLLLTLKSLGEATPQSLLAAAYWSEESRMAALPMLWKLLGSREIHADFHLGLTMSSAIWLPE